MHDFTRRGLIGGAAAGALAAAARPGWAADMPYGLKPGKPYAGTEVVALLPNAAQYRAQKKRLPQLEELTGIKLTQAYIPYGQLLDKITAEAVAGSSAYDLVTYQDSWGPALVPYIDPVDGWLKRDGLSLDTYPKAFARASAFDGKTYGLPVRAQAQLLYYRDDLLKQAGMQPPKTWDEVASVGKAIQDKTGVSGIAMDYGKGNGFQNLFIWLSFLWGNGSDLIDDAGKPLFNNAGGIKGTQDYVDLLLKHKVANPASVQFNEGDMVNSMAQGKSAMVLVWTWGFTALTGPRSTLKREQVGFVPAPAFPGHPNTGLGQCMPFSVSKLSKKKEAAWEALKWMANPDLEVEIATDTSDPSTTEIIVAHTASFENAKVNAVTGGLQKVELQGLQGARSMPQMTEWPQVASVLENAVSVLVTSDAKVKPTMDDAAQQVSRIMRRSRRGR